MARARLGRCNVRTIKRLGKNARGIRQSLHFRERLGKPGPLAIRSSLRPERARLGRCNVQTINRLRKTRGASVNHSSFGSVCQSLACLPFVACCARGGRAPALQRPNNPTAQKNTRSIRQSLQFRERLPKPSPLAIRSFLRPERARPGRCNVRTIQRLRKTRGASVNHSNLGSV
jgi:hypothetical protein